MEKNDSTVHSSFWTDVKKFATWNVNDPDHECDCPDPPPQFYLPPPPWPHCFSDFTCIHNKMSEVEICKNFSVISDEYHYSLTLTTSLVIPIIAVAIFLFIGAILVIIRRKKEQQLHPRKSSTISYCESATASSIIFEDMTDVHLRELTSLRSSCQLHSSEMIHISSCTSQNKLSPVFICSPSPVPRFHRPKDLFSPFCEEFANVSNEKGGTSGEGILSNFNSEDEYAKDELSLEEGIENYPNTAGVSRNTLLLGADVADFLKDFQDFPVADDRNRFLKNCGKNLWRSGSYGEKETRIFRRDYFNSSDIEKRLRRSDRKNENKEKSFSSSNSIMSCTNEGVFLKKLFQCYSRAPQRILSAPYDL